MNANDMIQTWLQTTIRLVKNLCYSNNKAGEMGNPHNTIQASSIIQYLTVLSSEPLASLRYST